VKAGDSGCQIAAANKVSISDLASANGMAISDLNSIIVGQTLKIPSPSANPGC
jgi:LysM repeat protein